MNNKKDLYLKQLQCITYFHLYLSSNLFRSIVYVMLANMKCVNDFKSMKDNFVLMFMKISIMYFEIDENGYKIRKNFSLFAIK